MKRILVIVGMFLLFSVVTLAETDNNASTSASQESLPVASTNTNTYLNPNQSFDLSLKKLPPDFQGHLIPELWNDLENLAQKFTPKDEFETSAAYKKRIENIYAKYKEIIFALPSLCTSAEYNADLQQFEIGLDIFSFEDDQLYISSDVTVSNVKTYTDNILGRNVEIRRQDWKIYGFGLTDNLNEDKKITLKIASNKAKLLKENNDLYMLYIGKACIDPTKGLFYHCKEHPTPTYTEQNVIYDHYNDYSLINVKLLEVWLYNNKTGEIYTKINLQSQGFYNPAD